MRSTDTNLVAKNVMKVYTNDATVLDTSPSIFHIQSYTDLHDPVNQLIHDWPILPQSHQGKCFDCWGGVLECIVD